MTAVFSTPTVSAAAARSQAVIKWSKSSTPIFQHLSTFSSLVPYRSSLPPPLQPQNILLTGLSPPGDIKIVDFGLARRLGAVGELREILGTPEYVGKVDGKLHHPEQGWANFWTSGL